VDDASCGQKIEGAALTIAKAFEPKSYIFERLLTRAVHPRRSC